MSGEPEAPEYDRDKLIKFGETFAGMLNKMLDELAKSLKRPQLTGYKLKLKLKGLTLVIRFYREGSIIFIPFYNLTQLRLALMSLKLYLEDPELEEQLEKLDGVLSEMSTSTAPSVMGFGYLMPTHSLETFEELLKRLEDAGIAWEVEVEELEGELEGGGGSD